MVPDVRTQLTQAPLTPFREVSSTQDGSGHYDATVLQDVFAPLREAEDDSACGFLQRDAVVEPDVAWSRVRARRGSPRKLCERNPPTVRRSARAASRRKPDGVLSLRPGNLNPFNYV